MWISWSVLVIIYIPSYSIRSEIWSLYLILSVTHRYKEICMVLTVESDYECRLLSHLLLWHLWTQLELFLSLSKKKKIKVFWGVLHQKLKTLIVRAGWQTRDKLLIVSPRFTVPVTSSLFSLKYEGTDDKYEVCVWEHWAFVAQTDLFWHRCRKTETWLPRVTCIRCD